jgi:contact-dependent growth inhibition (CDI) system CdiI-like immunity protein
MSAVHRGGQASEISAADFPALRDFLRGYFHEDMVDEYGSADEAARRFYHDADPIQRKAVAAEWEQFVERTKQQPLSAMNEGLIKLGSGYIVESDGDLRKISAVLEGRHFS